MLTSIKIINNHHTPFHYLKELSAFSNGKEYKFKKGINIIIGPNGCGKSTLLNLIALFTFCEDSMVTKIPNDALTYPHIFKENFGLEESDEEILDGVKIHHDFQSVVFRYKPSMEMREYQVMDNFDNFQSYVTGISASTGEKTLEGLGYLFKIMYSEKTDYTFPIKELKELKEKSNPVWSKRFKLLLNYYKENVCNISQEDFEYTVLLDEPDRNLDIDNIKSIYAVCSYHKPNTQLICVLHNPILIYKLSKLNDINWIEMKKGYLDKIKRFIEE